MRIVGLTREQLQRDVSEAVSRLALGRTQAVPSPVPAERVTPWELLPAQLCHILLLLLPLLQDVLEQTAPLCKINRE